METAAPKSKVAELVDLLREYADGLCELGDDHECCGRLEPGDCYGCKARAVQLALKAHIERNEG